MNRLLITILAAAAGARGATVAADSSRGEQLFETLSCIQCHSVNGKGGKVGPDLGRRIDRGFRPSTLASTMWNHAPAMWAAMRERDIRAGDLNEQAAADLFAYFYAARFFEAPGDAGRGKALFKDRSCAVCHGLTAATKAGIQPVNQWTALADPIDLTQAMWNHSPHMAVEGQLAQISWPKLTGQDLTDLLVYLRSVSPASQKPAVFGITAANNGESIFKAKQCEQCHSSYAALSAQVKDLTLTEIAAAMWNHPSKTPSPPARFEAGEMRDLLSDLWAKQFFQDAGGAGKGKHVFTAKRCASCHNDPSSGAPKLAGRSFTSSAMVSALWHHGPRMLERMKSKNIAWPRFDGHEMSDLIAYLNSAK